MTMMTKDELQVVLRLDLVAFVEGSFYELNPQTRYISISNDADRFKRFHSYCFGVHEHTLPMARESRLCGCVVSLVSPQPARAVSASSIRCGPPNISSVTIDHDELCDLPVGRRVA
jgi:hypothetical protein